MAKEILSSKDHLGAHRLLGVEKFSTQNIELSQYQVKDLIANQEIPDSF